MTKGNGLTASETLDREHKKGNHEIPQFGCPGCIKERDKKPLGLEDVITDIYFLLDECLPPRLDEDAKSRIVRIEQALSNA